MTNDSYVSIGQRLAAARQAKHLTLVDLAKVIGGDPSTINRWESGQTLPRNVMIWGAIADALDQDLDYLIRGTMKESYGPGYRDALNVARGRIDALLVGLAEEHNG